MAIRMAPPLEVIADKNGIEASLFGDAATRALINFVRAWTDDVLHPAIVPLVVSRRMK